MADRAISFTISLKDAVSKAAAKAETSMKDMRGAVAKAAQTVAKAEADAKALAEANVALAKSQKEVAEATAKAAPENMLLGKSLSDVLKAQERLQAVQKQNAAVQKAQKQAQDAATASAKKAHAEVARLSQEMSKQEGAVEDSGNEVRSFGRVLDQLAQGNIRGAIGALGSFGKAFIGLSGIATGAFAVFRMVKGAIEGIQERAKAARLEELRRGLDDITKSASETKRELEEIATRFDRLRAKSKEKIELQVSVFNTARNAARAQSEADYQKSIAGLTDPQLLAERAAANQRDSLFSQSNAVARDYSLQRKMLADEDKNLKARVEEMRRKAVEYAKDIKAASDNFYASLGTENEGEARKKWDDLLVESDAHQRSIIALEDRRKAIAEELTRSKKEEATAQKEIEAQAQALRNADEARAKAAEAAAKAKEREAKLRDQGFENSFGAMKDAALLEGDDKIEAAARWAIKPFEQAKDAADEAVSEIEGVVDSLKRTLETATGDQRVEAVNKLAEAEKELATARENAASAEKTLIIEGVKADLQAIAAKKALQEAERDRHDANRQRLGEELAALKARNAEDRRSEALSGGTTPAERRAAKRRAKAEAKAIRRFDNALANSQNAIMREWGVGKLTDDDFGEIGAALDDEGNITQHGSKRAKEALRKLSKSARKRLAAEARRKNEEAAKQDAIRNAQNAQNAAADKIAELNKTMSEINPNLVSVLEALTNISKIDMAAGENG